MRIKVISKSENAVRVAVLSRFNKLDEKPQPLPDLKDDDFQAFKDDLASHATYDALKNDDMENPFTDDRSV